MADDRTKTAYQRSDDKFVLNPAPSYNFAIQLEGFFFVPCKSIRVFTREHEFDYYQEGGLNDYVHMLRKPISKPFTFQVERYIGVSNTSTFNLSFNDMLALGTELILPVLLFVSRYPSYHFWENWNPQTCARVYTFTGCTVTAKEYGELNAERSGLATETTTIAYRELLVINNLSSSFDKSAWKDESKEETYTGQGEKIWFSNVNGKYAYKSKDTYTRQNGIDHAKEDMWVIDKDNYKGKGKRHVQTDKGDKNNPTKKDQESAAAKDVWGIDKDNYKGKGSHHVQTDKGDKNNPTRKDQEKKGQDEGWIIKGDDYKGNNKRHVQKDKGDKANPSKKSQESTGARDIWGIDEHDYKGKGKHHVQTDKGDKDNPSKKDQESKGEDGGWIISEDDYKGNDKRHVQTDKGDMNNPAKKEQENAGREGSWVIDSNSYKGSGQRHVQTDKGDRDNPAKAASEAKGKNNVWIYDGSVDGGGTPHSENRNKNTKADPVIWPPTRRALMADALSNT